jgi:hypothetical protein
MVEQGAKSSLLDAARLLTPQGQPCG